MKSLIEYKDKSAREERRLTITMTVFFVYLTLPVIFTLFMFDLLHSGAFPPEADSIGIPIFGFVIFWLACGVAFAVGTIIFCLIRQIYARKKMI
jgi:hypothetical protein